MKVQIECKKEIKEPSVTIHCSNIDDDIKVLEEKIRTLTIETCPLCFYRDNTEYYFPILQILFFETEGNTVYAHTKKETYRVKLRLYELEHILPGYFMRISKSAIVNIREIFAIDHNFPSYYLVRFYESHKQVSVSRFYYKTLKQKLKERKIL